MRSIFSLVRCAAWGLAGAVAVAASAAEPASTQSSQQQLEQQLEAARDRLDAAAREVGELSSQLGRDAQDRLMMRFPQVGPRAQLGVQVQRGDGGARVMAVSPGGPAEQAGIKQGDVITAIGGADLSKARDPGGALVERMRELDPGLKVKLAVQREGRKMEFDVTPRAAPPVARGMAGMGPGPGRFIIDAPAIQMRQGPDGARTLALRGPGPERFRGMELATLSERLGSYFGVKSGVLVVRAPRGDEFKLQDGDVIVAIDGREPSSAAHATRILGSYQPGEKLTLKVMRDRRAQNIEVTLPGAARARDGRGQQSAAAPRG